MCPIHYLEGELNFSFLEDKTAPIPVHTITIPIGIAVCPPPIPTNGATIAHVVSDKTPSSPEALSLYQSYIPFLFILISHRFLFVLIFSNIIVEK